jgi:abhydrolase domain-containing protein 6
MLIQLLHRLIRHRFHKLGFQSQFLDSDTFKIYYLERQNDSISRFLVFIHGIGTSSSTWIKTLALLNTPGTIICIDLPGHGFSKISASDPFFSLEKMDRALEILISQRLPFPITLIGHSLGGWLAARFSARHPHKVNHLVLIDNAGIYYSGVSEQADDFDIHSKKDVRRLLYKMWFKYPWYFKPFILPVYTSIKKKYIGEFIKSINKEDFLDSSLSSLTMPIDVIWGEEDKLISKESVAIMNKFLPKMKTHFIRNCGHVPQLERPRELASILNQIFDSAGNDKASS